MERLFELYKRVLLAHIGTKTVDSVFHSKSEEFYDLLFEVFHTISEKRQDIKEDQSMNCDEAKRVAYDSLEEAKSIIKSMITDNDAIGMDNLLRGLSDKLDFACGDARAFLREEEEETNEIQEPEMKPKINPIKVPKKY